MLRPSYLLPGDTIGLVAPARKPDKESLRVAKEMIEAWGFVVKLAPHLLTDNHAYLSATDQERIIDFQMMIDNDSVKAILCARGGYGTTRILDQLNFSKLSEQPKWIVGFSDITALHLKLSSIGIESIHATMPILFAKPEQKDAVEALRQLLIGNVTSLIAPKDSFNKIGETQGELIGGNLSLLVDSLGTITQLNPGNKILVIEEVDEYFYKVDRMLVQLKRANILPSLKGLVVGHFTDIKDSTLPFGETIKEIIRYHTREYNYPIGFNFSIGHEAPNQAFLHGADCRLAVTTEGSEISYVNETTSA